MIPALGQTWCEEAMGMPAGSVEMLKPKVKEIRPGVYECTYRFKLHVRGEEIRDMDCVSTLGASQKDSSSANES